MMSSQVMSTVATCFNSYTRIQVLQKEHIETHKYFRLSFKEPKFEDFQQYVRLEVTEHGELEETIGFEVPEIELEETVGIEIEVVRRSVIEEVVGLEITIT